MSPSPDVRLVDVDESVLGQLLDLAVQDASPAEVTPPLGSGPGWNAERLAWFRAYHRAAASGLDGPAREKSWAVVCDGSLAGSIRLKRTAPATAGPGTAETGIWLGRGYRGRGIGSAAFRLVLVEARRAGLGGVVARTSAGNVGAQRLLSAAGAALTHDDDGTVSAAVVLSR
jgi:ribosomal-protein-alanine N-acetyltransferase